MIMRAGWRTAPRKISANGQKTRNSAARPAIRSIVFDADGALVESVGVVGDTTSPFSFSAIAAKLRPALYSVSAQGTLDPKNDPALASTILTGWGYQHYRKTAAESVLLDATGFDAAASKDALHIVQSAFLIRDLINTPANIMGPKELADAALGISQKFNARAKIHVVTDERDFPMLWAVGKAATAHKYKDEAPRLFEMEWGDPADPKLILIGKGITYDTGGLAIKTGPRMVTMHRDMGGAAHALGLAHYLMASGQKMHIKLVLPLAKNAIGATAYENGAIITAKNGKTIEIENTDAEGRLVLSDALVHACADPNFADAPIVNFATLTGAGRSVCAPDVPVVMSNDNALARRIMEHGETMDDLYESVTIHKKHAGAVRGTFADLANSGGASFPGHSYAMHFLLNFVNDGRTLVHCDQPCWNFSSSAGKKIGGMDQGLRNFARLLPKIIR